MIVGDAHFDKWNKLKKQINRSDDSNKRVKESEIWWVTLGVNVGSEMNGSLSSSNYQRPVLVIKKFNRTLFLTVVLSSKHKNNRYYKRLADGKSSVILSQIRILSVKRFVRRVRKLNTHEFEQIKGSVINMLKNELPA